MKKPSPITLIVYAATINLTRVKITPSPKGNDPLSIVNYAIEQEEYDQKYCVFDKDTHPNYEQALQKIDKTKSMLAINSVPCFEYWLLLHFTSSTSPFAITGKNSAADNVIKKLRKYIENYNKGDEDTFSKTKDKIPLAIKHAKQAKNDCTKRGDDNPSTNVHILVETLQKLN